MLVHQRVPHIFTKYAHENMIIIPILRFCWGPRKGRERAAQDGARAVLGNHSFEQPPYEYVCNIYIYIIMGYQWMVYGIIHGHTSILMGILSPSIPVK